MMTNLEAKYCGDHLCKAGQCSIPFLKSQGDVDYSNPFKPEKLEQ
jgi:hypothetical protein